MINRWINFGTIGDKFPRQEYKQSAEEVEVFELEDQSSCDG